MGGVTVCTYIYIYIEREVYMYISFAHAYVFGAHRTAQAMRASPPAPAAAAWRLSWSGRRCWRAGALCGAVAGARTAPKGGRGAGGGELASQADQKRAFFVGCSFHLGLFFFGGPFLYGW